MNGCIGLGIGDSGEDGERGGVVNMGMNRIQDDHSLYHYQDIYGDCDGGIKIVFAIVRFFYLRRGG